MDPISLSAVLQFVICAGIVWVGRTQVKNSEALVRVETVLRGASGDNGLVSEVKSLRKAKHDLINEVHGIRADLELVCQRLEQVEHKEGTV